ncbi:1-aminocyclopropane-1-carboxylate synthase [Algoriphagus machipongonensis]|uniref:Aminotransferase n=2 Tax=Algoriphagus machipongonensis TaxID=388413 RepID=A3HWF3_9BACT|nr:1-aminocyclopropane-1-carboxylate synthase [Algoriphagus machipongonensis]
MNSKKIAKMSQSSLSQKGQTASESPARVDMEIYFEALDNPYHPTDNPKGALPMNVAENHLCWEMLRDRIQQVTREHEIPDWVASYGDPAGIPRFREATASFLENHLFGTHVNPDSLAFSVGATSVIEMTSFLLADPSDTAVIPAPSYPVYTGDIGVIPGVIRYDLQTHEELEELKNGIPINTQKLEQAKKDIEAKGSRFKILILTSPDNPTGGIYSEKQLRETADWCIANQIHLIVNEIYGLSLIDISHPEIKEDYPNPIEFVSFGKIMSEYQNPYLHFWYSFSKDFGVSGFRIGLLHSFNEELIQAYRNAGLSHSISNYTQWVMSEVLEDKAFLEQFFSTYRERLTESYLIVRKSLKRMNIPFNPSFGSLFVWMDWSKFLSEESAEGEEKLWMEIYQQTGVLLTPTNGFGHKKKGLYRMVITSLNQSKLQVAMDKLEDFTKKK